MGQEEKITGCNGVQRTAKDMLVYMLEKHGGWQGMTLRQVAESIGVTYKYAQSVVREWDRKNLFDGEKCPWCDLVFWRCSVSLGLMKREYFEREKASWLRNG